MFTFVPDAIQLGFVYVKVKSITNETNLSRIFWIHACRGVRYAKSLSIQYFIDINILQNSFIDIDIFKKVHIDSGYGYQYFPNFLIEKIAY